MRILLFSGSHPRHLFIHRALLAQFEICGVVSMRREPLIVSPPPGITEHDRRLFVRHFEERFAVEQAGYGDETPEAAFAGIPTLFCGPAELNTAETAEFVRRMRPDVVFIFGVDLIKEPVMGVLPHDKVNLHLGLSPWYRGAATLFWPFYNLEPQLTGATFHQIVPEADAGAVIHQCVPELRAGDGIHDVGFRTVVKARDDLVRLFVHRATHGSFAGQTQKTTGRLYLSTQFRAAHLRLIYDQFNNRIVDEYLAGKLGMHQPKLIQAAALATPTS
jgi:folate-dependent phosphoribosylglycinamide formyltransferase PurN